MLDTYHKSYGAESLNLEGRVIACRQADQENDSLHSQRLRDTALTSSPSAHAEWKSLEAWTTGHSQSSMESDLREKANKNYIETDNDRERLQHVSEVGSFLKLVHDSHYVSSTFSNSRSVLRKRALVRQKPPLDRLA